MNLSEAIESKTPSLKIGEIVEGIAEATLSGIINENFESVLAEHSFILEKKKCSEEEDDMEGKEGDDDKGDKEGDDDSDEDEDEE